MWFLVGAILTYVVVVVLAMNRGVRHFVVSEFVEFTVLTGMGGSADTGPPWAIAVAFDDKGTALIRELTRKNVSSLNGKGVRVTRHMVTTLDGIVMSTGTINIELGTYLRISGMTDESDEKAVDKLVDALHTGALLEFGILANRDDDNAAIDDAIKFIHGDSPEAKKTLEEAAAKGQPPPAPGTMEHRGEPKFYDLVLADGARSRVTYRWVKLGQQQERHLRLDAGSKDSDAWNKAAKDRGNATDLPDTAMGTRAKLLHGALFYSRENERGNPPAEGRAGKQVEYFVLVRKPEIDVATGKETPRIDSTLLKTTEKVSDKRPPSWWFDDDLPVFLILGLFAVVGVLLMLTRRGIRLPWAFIIGQWVALFARLAITLAK